MKYYFENDGYCVCCDKNGIEIIIYAQIANLYLENER